MSTTIEMIGAGVDPSELTTVDRDDAIAVIRKALKERSGKTWSVTGGRGTAWGWISVKSPPARRVGNDGVHRGDGTDYYMTEEECAELADLLGMERVHFQGASIAAASDYRRQYMAMALGLVPLSVGQRYWD